MSVKKLDYNGLQTLVGKIKNYISQLLANYLPLSGGTMTGDIVFSPNVQQSDGTYDNTGIFFVKKVGIKGTYPESNTYCTCHVARDNSNNEGVGETRYSTIETGIYPTGNVHTRIHAHKNDPSANSTVYIGPTYPATGDPYIEASHHIILSSGIELY